MKRIVSATLLVLVVFLVTRYLPPVAFLLMILLLLTLGVWEFCALTARRGFAPQTWAAVLGAAALPLAFYQIRSGVLAALTFVLLALTLLSLARQDRVEEKFGNLVMTFFPVVFLGLTFGFVMALRLLPGADGHDLPFLLLLVVAAADTGAYYGGRTLGRHSMSPSLSPKKTWEGLAAGVLCSVAAAFLARSWFMNRLSVADCIVLGILLAAFGVAGDLAESGLKRWAGAKDSSDLIPGHGGVLDRIDGLLFAAPVLFYYHLRFMEV